MSQPETPEVPIMPLSEALQVEQEVIPTPSEDDKLTAAFAKLLRDTVDNRLLGLEKLETEVVSLLIGYKGGLASLRPSVEDLTQGLQELVQVANRSREYAEILKQIAVVQGLNPETFTAKQIVHACFTSKQSEVLTPERVQLWVASHIKEAYKIGFRTLGLGSAPPIQAEPAAPPQVSSNKNPVVSKEDNVKEEKPKKIDPKSLTAKDIEAWALANKKSAREIGMVLIKNQGKPEDAIRKTIADLGLPEDPMIDGMLGWAMANRASATMLIMKIGPKLL